MALIPGLYNEIKRIKIRIFDVGEMMPGSISERYTVCGKKGCRCKDKENPQKHGPYYHLSYTFDGKSCTEFVSEEALPMIKTQIRNYKKFRELSMELVRKEIELSKELRKQKKEANLGCEQ